jgi:uridine kinase
MSVFDLSDIAESINSAKKFPILIAIDGAGCVGKSTLASELAALVGGEVVHFDDFYRVMESEARETLGALDGYQLYFDWQRLKSEVLSPLLEGKRADYGKYDWGLDRLSAPATIEPNGIVIIEGVYSFRPELRSYYTKSIFVEASSELRRSRAVARGQNSDEWIRRWMAAEDYYLQDFNPRPIADWVFDGKTGKLIS